jgi:agmatine/peptidylarginine deiminase
MTTIFLPRINDFVFLAAGTAYYKYPTKRNLLQENQMIIGWQEYLFDKPTRKRVIAVGYGHSVSQNSTDEHINRIAHYVDISWDFTIARVWLHDIGDQAVIEAAYKVRAYEQFACGNPLFKFVEKWPTQDPSI